MILPGHILFHRDFKFNDGATKDKYLVVLGKSDHHVVVAKTTSKGSRYRPEVAYDMRPDVPTPIMSSQDPLPSGWAWSRLASLFKVITDGDHQPPPRAETGVAFLTIGNVTTGQLDFSNCRFVPQEYFDAIAPHRRPTKGDFLYTVVGATYGRPALVDTDRPFCVQRHIGILKPVSEIDLGYLHLLLAFRNRDRLAATADLLLPTVGVLCNSRHCSVT